MNFSLPVAADTDKRNEIWSVNSVARCSSGTGKICIPQECCPRVVFYCIKSDGCVDLLRMTKV